MLAREGMCARCPQQAPLSGRAAAHAVISMLSLGPRCGALLTLLTDKTAPTVRVTASMLALAGLLPNPSLCTLPGALRTLAATSHLWECLECAASAGPAASSAAAAAATIGGRAFSTASAPGPAQAERSAAAAASVPVERLQRIITPQLCNSLRRNGYAGGPLCSGLCFIAQEPHPPPRFAWYSLPALAIQLASPAAVQAAHLLC